MKFTVLFVLLTFAASAQLDSCITVPMIGVHVGGQLPFADLSSRFGPDLTLGGIFMVKTKHNWVYGVESNYFFGRNVKEDVLKQLKTKEGNVTDNEGYPADLRVTERGAGAHVLLGRVFSFASQNPNSGLMVYVGAGVMQHKIKLYDAQQRVAAVKGELAYGYDRLSLGVSFTQFIGYLFLSENRLLNFYFGVEGYEAFTKSLRRMNYDTGLPDTKQRFDGLAGFRFGWILPLYKKKPNDYYFY